MEYVSIKKRFETELRNLLECSTKKSYISFLITTGDYNSPYGNFDYNLILILNDLIRDYDKKNNIMMTFGKSEATNAVITRQDTMKGTRAQIAQKVQISNNHRPPSIISKDFRIGCSGASDVFPHKVSKPRYIINIGKDKLI